ncbi:hypothetical protein CDAR_40521 [Caerostris darwini]|uniref:Uncharacterized protein n=1 Tax=Caerostris darwini TaxID=1538125 RepID=A0AAV4RB48_9ARAC|nr:hypothetical protein CDAR_40521 [Caerostris darwini]
MSKTRNLSPLRYSIKAKLQTHLQRLLHRTKYPFVGKKPTPLTKKKTIICNTLSAHYWTPPSPSTSTQQGLEPDPVPHGTKTLNALL